MPPVGGKINNSCLEQTYAKTHVELLHWGKYAKCMEMLNTKVLPCVCQRQNYFEFHDNGRKNKALPNDLFFSLWCRCAPLYTSSCRRSFLLCYRSEWKAKKRKPKKSKNEKKRMSNWIRQAVTCGEDFRCGTDSLVNLINSSFLCLNLHRPLTCRVTSKQIIACIF